MEWWFIFFILATILIFVVLHYQEKRNKVIYLAPNLEIIKNMGGFPPGMTKESYLSPRGIIKMTQLNEEQTRLDFRFWGLIPKGVYTLWNVISMKPFKDEPLGKRFVVKANQQGWGEAIVILNKPPGEVFLLDYHSDGKITPVTGDKSNRKPGETKFGGTLHGKFPEKK